MMKAIDYFYQARDLIVNQENPDIEKLREIHNEIRKAGDTASAMAHFDSYCDNPDLIFVQPKQIDEDNHIVF